MAQDEEGDNKDEEMKEEGHCDQIGMGSKDRSPKRGDPVREERRSSLRDLFLSRGKVEKGGPISPLPGVNQEVKARLFTRQGYMCTG